jgi:hypothetical protein
MDRPDGRGGGLDLGDQLLPARLPVRLGDPQSGFPFENVAAIGDPSSWPRHRGIHAQARFVLQPAGSIVAPALEIDSRTDRPVGPTLAVGKGERCLGPAHFQIGKGQLRPASDPVTEFGQRSAEQRIQIDRDRQRGVCRQPQSLAQALLTAGDLRLRYRHGLLGAGKFQLEEIPIGVSYFARIPATLQRSGDLLLEPDAAPGGSQPGLMHGLLVPQAPDFTGEKAAAFAQLQRGGVRP